MLPDVPQSIGIFLAECRNYATNDDIQSRNNTAA